MDGDVEEPRRVRASDAEREKTVAAINAALGEGRLTMEEGEDRIAAIYATRFRDELAGFTADLPAEPTPSSRRFPTGRGTRRAHPALLIHAVVVLFLAISVVSRWAVSGAGFFWPAFPILWLSLSLLVHARFRGWWPIRG